LAVERIAEAVRISPFVGKVYAVGGSVRDSLLYPEGTEGMVIGDDIDLVVEGDSAALVSFLVESGITEGPAAVYANFGTAQVRVHGQKVEFVTARKESYRGESRKPTVESATLLEDAKRRDFTVNALLRSIESGEVLDPLGTGLSDLASRVLRTPLDPGETFSEDPLRMLRAVRFLHKLDFKPAPGLFQAIQENAHRLEIVSAERIQEEFAKTMLGPHPAQALRDYENTGLLAQIFPEFLPSIGCDHGPYHHLDVWDHTLAVVEKIVRPSLALRLAALFHDVAKPETKTLEASGRPRFFGHEIRGAEIASESLDRLRFSKDLIEEVAHLVRHHMRLGSAIPFSSTAARRLIRDMGDQLEEFLELVDADSRSHHPEAPRLNLQAVRDKLVEVQQTVTVKELTSPLTGREIMDLLKIEGGPKVGFWKHELEEAVLEGVLTPGDKDAATVYLLQKASQSQ
jgi:poly(A) polymerase